MTFVQGFGLWSIQFTGTIERVALQKDCLLTRTDQENIVSEHTPLPSFSFLYIGRRTPPTPPIHPPPAMICALFEFAMEERGWV